MKLDSKKINRIKIRAGYILVIFLIIIIIAVSLSCNITDKRESVVNDTAETGGAEAGEEIQDQSSADIIEINIWDSSDPKVQIALLDSIEKFLSLTPGLAINTRHFRSEEELLDQFEAASLAGSGPEILISRLESSNRLAKSKTIKQLTGYFDYSSILDGLKEISFFSGVNYVVPFRAYNFLMLYYNKEFITDIPVNFNELLKYCNDVKQLNDDNYGFLLNAKEPDWIIPFVGGYQDWIYDYSTGAISLKSEAMKKTLEFLDKIYSQEKILPYDMGYEEINNAFKAGNAHMIINGNWAVDEYREGGINFGVARIPIVLGGYKNPTPMLDGIGFMININCYGDEFIASRELINYLMSDEIQAGWTSSTLTLPAIKGIEQKLIINNEDVWQAAMQQAGICRGKPPDEFLRAIRDAVRINLENVIKGNITIDEAVVKMQEDAVMLKSGSVTVEDLTKEATES
ncbi:MAG: extracellular solute-binding protein [Actinobacteria bacterium]|nr:extracellular solute-binding protein [Actinomycetota bacterium]